MTANDGDRGGRPCDRPGERQVRNLNIHTTHTQAARSGVLAPAPQISSVPTLSDLGLGLPGLLLAGAGALVLLRLLLIPCRSSLRSARHSSNIAVVGFGKAPSFRALSATSQVQGGAAPLQVAGGYSSSAERCDSTDRREILPPKYCGVPARLGGPRHPGLAPI